MTAMNKILLIEDDFQLGEVVKTFLKMSGYSVVLGVNAEEGLRHTKQQRFDCVVLDLNLPDEDGLVVLRKLRTYSDIPVIICSARKSTEERILGLEFGAQDYLSKPYSPKELVLRIAGLIGLNQKDQIKASPSNSHAKQLWLIDHDKKGLLNSKNGQFVDLTISEFYLFLTLSQQEDKVYSRAELIDGVSKINGPDNDRAVDVCISRLRKKLEAEPANPAIIITHRGYGYSLVNRSENV